MKHLALVTCEDLKTLEPDDQQLKDLLAPQGVQALPCVWDDPAVDWSGFDLVLLRTCWDYYLKLPNFLGWLDRISKLSVPCLNPVPLVKWNHHKAYLQDLSSKGLPVVPLHLLPKAEALEPDSWWDLLKTEKLVVKPAVSAGSWNTFIFQKNHQPPNWEIFLQVHQSHDFLVQPFLQNIVDSGELSLIFWDGQFSHAVLKTVGKGDFRVQHQFGGKMVRVDPEPATLELAQQTLEKVPHPWFYGRVDMVKENGVWQIMEVELIEPAMFFEFAPEQLSHFAGRIIQKLKPIQA